ncbi:MAG: hypothetical protein ACYDGR_04310 [Candidatus Dormibacteria bacterium]
MGLMRSLGIGALLCTTSLTGCQAQANPQADPAFPNVLLDHVGATYRLDQAASGALDANAASQATPVPPASLKPLLGAGFRGAYVRLWRAGDQYITDTIFSFSTSPGAARLSQTEVEYLRGSRNANVFAARTIPGAGGYLISASRRNNGRQVFCEGFWMSAGSRAAEVRVCGALPYQADYQVAESLASEQYLRLQSER